MIAAVPKMFFPFLVILPGLIAVCVSSQTFDSTPSAAIAHSVGMELHPHGIIPQKINPVNGMPVVDSNGAPVYNYDLATPLMLLRFFPSGMLGLGITALIASFMSGMAGNVTAFNTVWTYDIYQNYINKNASDLHYLWMGRVATVGGTLLSIGAAYAVISFNNIFDALQLIFSLVNAPLFATFLLGMFWKRTTGHAAFTGLLCGSAAALLHHGLTLPLGATPGFHGGWIHSLHLYPSDMAQNFWTAIISFSVNLVVTMIISFLTTPKAEAELVGLVYSLTPRRPDSDLVWYKRPIWIAAVVGGVAVVLNFWFE